MNQDTTEASDCTPVNFWMNSLESIANPLSRFSEGLQIAQYCVLDQLSFSKGQLTFLAIPLDALYAIQYVRDVKADFLHKGIASWSTRSRIRG